MDFIYNAISGLLGVINDIINFISDLVSFITDFLGQLPIEITTILIPVLVMIGAIFLYRFLR